LHLFQIFVKNPEGEIIKGMPIRVTKAHTLKIVSHPYPESKQLILDNVYEIKVEIYDKEERQIYPSEVKNTFLILRNALLSNNEISRTS